MTQEISLGARSAAEAWAWQQRGLTPGAHLLLLALVALLEVDGCTTNLRSRTALAQAIDMSSKTIDRASDELEAKQLVKAYPIFRRSDGRQMHNHYALNVEGLSGAAWTAFAERAVLDSEALDMEVLLHPTARAKAAGRQVRLPFDLPRRSRASKRSAGRTAVTGGAPAAAPGPAAEPLAGEGEGDKMSPSRRNGQVQIAELVDAFVILGLDKPKLLPAQARDARLLLANYAAADIAAVYQAVIARQIGDRWMHDNLSFSGLLGNDRMGNLLRDLRDLETRPCHQCGHLLPPSAESCPVCRTQYPWGPPATRPRPRDTEDGDGSSQAAAIEPDGERLLDTEETTLADTWQQVLIDLQLQIRAEDFSTWFRELRLLSIVNNVCTIATANEFAIEWLNRRGRGLVGRSIASVLGEPVEVRFVVAETVAAITLAQEAP